MESQLIHRIRSLIEEEGKSSFRPFLALDKSNLVNALNLVDRGAIYDCVCKEVPELESWFLWSYGSASRLQFGSYI